MRRSREMGLAGMSHHPCRDQKTTDPEKPSFPSLPHRCSLSRRGAGETCPRQGAFQAHGGDRILAASADYYAVDPLPPVEKKRRGARSADSSSVHYRRSSVHIRRETRPKTGSTDRFREPHAPSDPGTHTTASLSLSLLLSPLLAPRRSKLRFLQGIARLEGIGTSFLPVGSGDFRDSATRSTDVGRSLCLPTPYFRRGMHHLGMHHRASTLSPVKYYTERNGILLKD